MTHDNDLIRRGDVLDAMCKGPRTVQERIDAIRAIAVHPDPRDEVIAGLVEALTKLRDLMCEAIEVNDGNLACGHCENDCTGCIAHAALAAVKGGVE